MVIQAALFAMSFGMCDSQQVPRCESISQDGYNSLANACKAEGEQVFYQHPKLERTDYYEVVCVLNRVYACRLALLGVQQSELPHTNIQDALYDKFSYTCLVYPTLKR